MRKNHIIKFAAMALSAFCYASCMPDESYKDLDSNGQNLYGQQAMLFKIEGTNKKQASFNDISSVEMEDGGEQDNKVKFNYQAVLVKKNEGNIAIGVKINPGEVDKYNRVYGTSYKAFPADLAEYTTALKVDSGDVSSDIGVVSLAYSDELQKGEKYLLALSAQSDNKEVGVMTSSKTLLYSVEVSDGKIRKSALLTRATYFRIDRGNSVVSGIGKTFTLEGLINVSKFRDKSDVGDAQISTFMGTEGATLLRFGDAGIDGNRLQANGTDAGITFETNKWYHIALVVNDGQSAVYVNGKKVISFTKGGSLGDFFIGRSYNDNRGIEARVSELRIWSTARTDGEISGNMYKAKDLTGIYAYWKMNETKGGRIEDVSGNGNDLVLWGQPSDKQETIVLVDEEEITVE